MEAVMSDVISFNTCYDKKRQGGDYMCKILEKIRNKTASELLQEYEIDMKPPIDIATLLSKIGISTIAHDFTEIEESDNREPGSILGAALSNENSLAIFYKKTDSFHRKKFTIAHELAHCCLHSENLQISHFELRTQNSNLDARELDANIFAGELLIPQNVLMPIYNEFILPSLSALAKQFDVSTNVMAARLDYLKLQYFKDVQLSEE